MIDRLNYIFNRIFYLLLPINIVALACMMTLQTILRYVFHKPLLFMEELMLIPSLCLYFFGGIWATRTETHMNARLLEILTTSDINIARIRALSAFLGAIISAWLAYWGADLLRYSLKVKKVSIVLNYRLTIVECLPFVCFSAMSVLLIFEFLRYFKKAR